ncbi:MAG: H(+)/Cl(-) exchange transporter ClcA [Verrucomicrobia bacterium]|nr:H(+)/Cl(-) exchange transporter ClcA [Verrucomicrobiota bacterium]
MQATPTTGFGLGTAEVKRRHILLKAILIGVVSGLMASAFRVTLVWAENKRIAWQHALADSRWTALGLALGIGAAGGGLAVRLVRRFAPETAGSGIPHLKAVVLGERTLNWRRVLPVKFLGGVLGIGGGFALGREGPTIQMGGATGLMVSDWFRVKPGEGERKALISAGAGAGLAAAFNAPLAGLVFVLEELQGNFTSFGFVAAFLACVSADVVARVLTGEMPVFAVRDMVPPGLGVLPVALLLGALCGLGGVIFNKCLLKSLDLADRLHARWSPFAVGALAGVVVGLASWLIPGSAGSGGSLAERALSGEFVFALLPLLLVVRFLLTMVSYGSGAAGGIFAPLLVIGALGGLATGRVAHTVMPAWAPHAEVFAVIGMGALLTAIVRAPLTGIVLMIELTGQYGFMLPLLASCLVAYGVAELLKDAPIYEALRERSAHKEAAAAAARAAQEAR